MPVFIYEKDAFRKIATVEGILDFVRQHGTFGDHSFFAFFQKWQEIYALAPAMTTVGEHITLDVGGSATIYGYGGVNRYAVYLDGEIVFLRLQAANQDAIERALREGFRVL